ncbi:peptidase [Agarivorans sp. Toyoura001]|uniref:metalloprotease TldD n=1 Tax=Agarivorans sp. Toyoura001 TaxID=2283141 RepID=UPI0010E5D4F6|nr:metalloprotease TldD [Agarivorans sp. Toyoura001]GDY26491.1 peptidase [Agarivorans sp. Toyoura001]
MSFEKVSQSLLVPGGIGEQELTMALTEVAKHQIDYADLYFQHSRHESWVLEDGIVKEGSYNIEQGVGVRAISGEQTGFAYSDVINQSALIQTCQAARGISAKAGSAKVKPFSRVSAEQFYQSDNPLVSLSNQQKIALLERADKYARSLDSSVTQVIVSLSGVYEEVLVAASDGTLAADIRPLIRFNCSVLVERNERRERGSAGGGGRSNYSYFLEDVNGRERAMGFVDEAVRQALVNLEAVDAPAGLMPVVLGAGWPGVLLHEAVGHGLEGDFNRKGSSAFSGCMGEKVASSLCTVVDDGTMGNRRGSVSIDDEGTPGQYNVLIEKGVLKGYMQDKHNAQLMNTHSTGNGRRESYAHLPLPRMTNTYMLSGESEPEELIASVKRGIYAPNFGGGQVDITSGKFVFSASEAYLIEDGKITAPIKGATLIGSGPEAMQQVSMVGNDLALDQGVGVCGKEGQSVPVGVGQPSLKLDELTVGGTA